MRTETSDLCKSSQALKFPQSSKSYWVILLLVWSASALYMGTHLLRGWVPHDEGAFAQSAERVLQGQLPHRDFVEIYSGGLTFVHALAFRSIGVNLATLRYVLFAAFLAWIPAVYYVASRFGSPLAAGAVTLLCTAWSVPNYAAAVPSWYNLFFATFGVAALLRYLEARARAWIFVAGLCGGLSFTVKSVGLYYLASVWLFFLFREQSLNQSQSGDSKLRSRLYRAVTAFSVIFLVTLIVLLIRQRRLCEDVVHFVLPTAALAFCIFLRESRGIQAHSARRFSTLAHMAVPFFAGVLLPVLIFLIPFVWGHAIADLIRGIFILPARRISGAAMAPPKVKSIVAVALMAAMIALAALRDGLVRRIAAATMAVFLASIWLVASRKESIYQAVWLSAANLIPVLAVLGVTVLSVPLNIWRRLPSIRPEQLMLLFSVTVLCSLVQFPFAAAIYFCYVAPLAVLALFAFISCLQWRSKSFLLYAAVFYILFAVTRIMPGFIYGMEESYKPERQTTRLHLERGGGLRVTPDDAALTERLIALVREHANSRFIYAAPDCPEVYFLSGLQNPTRTLFDFLDDRTDESENILALLESHNVNLIVINGNPAFSSELPDSHRKILEQRYPSSSEVGEFEVRWRP